jgi:hypothetical protein
MNKLRLLLRQNYDDLLVATLAIMLILGFAGVLAQIFYSPNILNASITGLCAVTVAFPLIVLWLSKD